MPAKALPRRRDGRIDWKDPSTRRMIAARLRLGHSMSRIERDLGMPDRILYQYVPRLGLDFPPDGWLLALEIAALDGTDSDNVIKRLTGRGCEKRHWGERAIFREEDVQAWLDERGQLPLWTALPAGYTTAPRLMKDWRTSKCTVQRAIRRAGVKPVATLRDGTKVYEIEPILACRSRTLHLKAPRGHVKTEAIAEMAGVSCSSVRSWANRGCPRTLVHQGRSRFDPHAVLHWLEQEPDPRRQRAASRLREALTPQENAA